MSQAYYKGTFIWPTWPNGEYTNISYSLTGIGLAIGWFLRSRAAILVGIGTLITWGIVVPMIIVMNIPVYVPAVDGYVSPWMFPMTYTDVKGNLAYLFGVSNPPDAANKGIAKLVAIGAILGGGLTALLKMSPTFYTVFKDIRKTTGATGEKREYVPGKGWYEWPPQHIKIMMVVCAVGVAAVFFIGGCPIVHSIIFGILLVLVTFVLGAIAVKVSGEIGTTPVSGTSFICLTLLWGVFILLRPLPHGPHRHYGLRHGHLTIIRDNLGLQERPVRRHPAHAPHKGRVGGGRFRCYRRVSRGGLLLHPAG